MYSTIECHSYQVSDVVCTIVESTCVEHCLGTKDMSTPCHTNVRRNDDWQTTADGCKRNWLTCCEHHDPENAWKAASKTKIKSGQNFFTKWESNCPPNRNIILHEKIIRKNKHDTVYERNPDANVVMWYLWAQLSCSIHAMYLGAPWFRERITMTLASVPDIQKSTNKR